MDESLAHPALWTAAGSMGQPRNRWRVGGNELVPVTASAAKRFELFYKRECSAMTCALATILLTLLTVLNFFVGKRRVLYPPFIFSTIWTLDLVIFKVSPIELNEVHAITWWVITAGALIFSIGGWLTRFIPRAVFVTRVRELSQPTASRLGRIILLSISLLAVPIMLHNVAQRGAGGNGDVLSSARESLVNAAEKGGAPGFLFANLPLFSICVVIICLIERRDKFFWIALSLAVACCVLTTGRTFILMLFSAVAATLILKNKEDNLAGLVKFAVAPFLLFAVLFISLIFTSKDVSGFRGNTEAIVENFALAYIVAPLPALDYVLMHPSEYSHDANHTFGLLWKLLASLGFDTRVPPQFDKVTFVPLPTNVYTVYKFFFTDFGLVGMLIAVLVIGFVQTSVYWRVVDGGRISLYLCALLIFPAIISTFDDQYTGSIFLLLKAAVIAVAYFCFLNRLHSGIPVPRFHLGIWPARRREM